MIGTTARVEAGDERRSAAAEGLGRAAAWAALALLAAIVLAHAALLPGGRWQGDEYGGLEAYHSQGWAFFRYRLLHWSPRPVSEALIWLYATVVYACRAPLIAPALGVAWAILVAAAIAGLCRRGKGLVWTGLIVAAVLAGFLLGHPVGEMFYWPMGALAYLPALAGVTCAAFLIVRGLAGASAWRQRLGCLASLLLATGSAEVGAMVTVCVCGLIGLTELAGWRAFRRRPGRLLAEAAWWAVPLAAAAGILVLLLGGRAGSAAEAQNGAIAHHVVPSLLAGWSEFARLLIAPDAPAPGVAWWQPVVFLGLAASWRRSRAALAPARHLLALAAGLLIAAYGSLASAAYQFGAPCCQRHDSFRACLVVLALTVLAALAARLRVWRHVPAVAGPALLVLGLLPPLLDRLPAWRADLRQQGAVIAIRRANWAAGAAPGPAMVLRQAPAPHVVNDGNLPVRGRIDRAAGEVPWFVAGVLDFFGKSAVDIEGP